MFFSEFWHSWEISTIPSGYDTYQAFPFGCTVNTQDKKLFPAKEVHLLFLSKNAVFRFLMLYGFVHDSVCQINIISISITIFLAPRALCTLKNKGSLLTSMVPQRTFTIHGTLLFMGIFWVYPFIHGYIFFIYNNELIKSQWYIFILIIVCLFLSKWNPISSWQSNKNCPR